VRVRFRGNVFTEPLLRNGRLFIRLLHSNGCARCLEAFVWQRVCMPQYLRVNIGKQRRVEISLCKKAHPCWISGCHSSDGPLDCKAVWFGKCLTFQRIIAPPSSGSNVISKQETTMKRAESKANHEWRIRPDIGQSSSKTNSEKIMQEPNRSKVSLLLPVLFEPFTTFSLRLTHLQFFPGLD
jgi:hypothetical protein